MLAAIKDSLSTQLQPLEKNWHSLAERERKLIKVLSIVLLIALFYWLIWSPIVDARQEAERKLENAQSEWLWLNQQHGKLESTEARIKQAQVTSQAALTAYLQQQVRQQNISGFLAQMTPIKSGRKDSIEVSFSEVPSPRFFRWLSKMEKEGVAAVRVQLQPVKKGVLMAKAQFEVQS